MFGTSTHRVADSSRSMVWLEQLQPRPELVAVHPLIIRLARADTVHLQLMPRRLQHTKRKKKFETKDRRSPERVCVWVEFGHVLNISFLLKRRAKVHALIRTSTTSFTCATLCLIAKRTQTQQPSTDRIQQQPNGVLIVAAIKTETGRY